MKKKKTEEQKAKLNKKEITELIVKLSNEGMSPTKIGQTLKDTYGVLSVKAMTGEKIKKILATNKITIKIPDDLQNLIKNAEALKKHLEKNKQDKIAGRGLLIAKSKIIELIKYYKRKGILPGNWQY
jgi:small subunit ribosomal protein S13e